MLKARVMKIGDAAFNIWTYVFSLCRVNYVSFFKNLFAFCFKWKQYSSKCKLQNLSAFPI